MSPTTMAISAAELFWNLRTDDIRIERYTSAAPGIPTAAKPEQTASALETHAASPTSSLRTNISSSVIHGDSHPYQQFPAQAARLRASHSQAQLNAQDSQATSSPLQRPVSRDPSGENSGVTSAPLAVTKESSWPAEHFADRHISATEPRIFPGIVSRNHRRQSSVRKSSMSETDDHASASASRKNGKSPGKNNLDSAVEEQENDMDVEEAGSLDG